MIEDGERPGCGREYARWYEQTPPVLPVARIEVTELELG
jgi:hypothetical protein